jgi:dienelactone hydrolase
VRPLLACLLVALAGCAGQAAPIPAQTGHAATLPTDLGGLGDPGFHAIKLGEGTGTAAGFAAIPANGQARSLVVLAKGLGGKAEQWRPLMEDLARQGTASIAMEYRGEAGAWKVEAAVQDTLAATAALKAAHPEAQRVVLVGYSMGGEVSGLVLARAPPGTFTHWVEGSGVMDLAAQWRETVTFQPLIEAEAGGRPDEVPDRYQALSPLGDVRGIAQQGLHRAYIVHGVADVIVPVEQGDRMADALKVAGVPLSYTVVATEPAAWACTPLVLVCAPTQAPDAPANHEAGISPLVLRLVRDLAAGAADPQAPYERHVVDAATGLSVDG